MARWKTKATKSARVAAKRAERLRNIGPDASGNYGVNPYAARGHLVEVAPKELRDNPNSQQFPKRIVTQRTIDRYLAHGHISAQEWKAAETLLRFWHEAGLHAKVTSGYDPVMVQSSPNMDARLAKYLDGALGYTRLMRAVPYHRQGVVRAVVIEDMIASDWARRRGYRRHDAERRGLGALRAGLQALVVHLGV